MQWYDTQSDNLSQGMKSYLLISWDNYEGEALPGLFGAHACTQPRKLKNARKIKVNNIDTI